MINEESKTSDQQKQIAQTKMKIQYQMLQVCFSGSNLQELDIQFHMFKQHGDQNVLSAVKASFAGRTLKLGLIDFDSVTMG